MLTIKKAYTNNIALVTDHSYNEFIVMGKGIAFQKRNGDTVNESQIEKKFILDSEKLAMKLTQLLNEVPLHYIEVTDRIVKMAERELKTEFNECIYITLSDHLNYAISRANRKIDLPNAMLCEIRKFYKNEFRAAKKAVDMIYNSEKTQLSDNEAGYITLHFVNAQMNSDSMTETISMVETINDIVKLVQEEFGITLDEESVSYIRFITHIRFFLKRIFSKELYESDDEDAIYHSLKIQYPKEDLCSEKIAQYVRKKYNVGISLEEKAYFIIQIHRVAQRCNN
jgi:Transcriptional antiterminator